MTETRTVQSLRFMQDMPLSAKLNMTKQLIEGWYNSWAQYEITDSSGNKRYTTEDVRDGIINHTPKLKSGETVTNIREGAVAIQFSGGKDSTVLLDITRQLFPDVEAVYIDTGLEYPEIRKFATSKKNVTVIRPSMRFDQVIKKYGYPMISKEVSANIYEARFSLENWNGEETIAIQKLKGTLKNAEGGKSDYCCTKYEPLIYTDFVCGSRCCDIMKKKPAKDYAKKTGNMPITGQLAEESELRKTQWLKNGCNGFDMKSPVSNPLSFWTDQDILEYIHTNNLEIASVYGEVEQNENGEYYTTGVYRTGCIFCGFGLHLEKAPSRFEKLKETHPKQYAYCIEGGERNVYGQWVPSQNGLGMKHIFDELNKIYGEGFVRY